MSDTQIPVPTPAPIQPVISSSKLPLILISLLLILFAGAGVYLGKYLYGPKTPAFTQVTPIGVPFASPTVDPTVDWETYTNPKYSFSFQYPAEVFQEKIEGPDWYDAGSQWTNEKGKSFAELNKDTGLQLLVGAESRETISQTTDPHTEIEQTVAVGPFQSSLALYEPSINDVIPHYALKVSVTKEDSNYSFSLEAQNKEILASNTELFKQILSTFRFTNLESSQHYTCPANGYVDCMPIIESSRQWQCGKTYIDWVRQNCPNFKGVTQ